MFLTSDKTQLYVFTTDDYVVFVVDAELAAEKTNLYDDAPTAIAVASHRVLYRLHCPVSAKYVIAWHSEQLGH